MEYENIFITGSTGVVGKPLLKKLAGKGHKVYALDRSKNSNDEFEKIGVTSIQGDLFDDSKTLSSLIGRPTTPLSEAVKAVLA